MFSLIFILLQSCFCALVFTGNKTFDDMVMEEHTLIIGNPMGADVQIMKSFFQQVQAKAEIVDPESLGHTQYTLRSLLQNWEPHYGVWQVYPAVICEARYIGGLREVQRYYQTGELKDIAMMKKKVGVQCFHDDTKKGRTLIL